MPWAGLAGTACTATGKVGTSGGAGGNDTSSAGSGGDQGGGAGGAAGAGGITSVVTIILPDASTQGGAGGSTTPPPPVWPPPDFVNVTDVSFGAYALGPLTSTLAAGTGGQSGAGGEGGSAATVCAGLFGVVRDFKMGNLADGHPDFQSPPTSRTEETGIVTGTLGDDGKPVYANPGGTTRTTSGQENFDQWYRDVEGVNLSYVVALHFIPNPAAGANVVTFSASINNSGGAADSSYFPLDGQGWNDEARGEGGEMHNFAFTTEFHTSFIYNGGEVFTFDGDDDVFVYINKILAIDLGGIHNQVRKTVDLDAEAATLGLTKGNVYDLAVFNAERHTTQSNFRIDTTMVFTDCGKIDGIIY